MANSNETKIEFADFIREYLENNKPADWNNALFGEFPGTISTYQKYFGYILKQNNNSEKVEAIEKRYKLNKSDKVEKKIKIIDGRPRSITKFFNEKIVPYDKNLYFIAVVFDAPIKTIEEFVKRQENEKKQLTKKPEKAKKESFNIDNEIISEINEPKEDQNDRLKQFFTKNKKIIGSVSLILLLFISVFLFQKYGKNNELKAENMHPIISTFFPREMADSLYVKKTTANNSENILSEDTILLHTVNIFNDKCLYKNSDWSFSTDPEGEDMNSKYGTPFNDEIKTHFNVLNGRTTIANEYMDIHFNIENLKNKTLYFSNLKIKIIDTHDAKVEKAKYNMYEIRSSEVIFEIILDDKNMKGCSANKEELKNGEALFCKLRIKGSEFCNNLIYELQIIADFSDIKGNHYQGVSDKNYFIGFVAEN